MAKRRVVAEAVDEDEPPVAVSPGSRPRAADRARAWTDDDEDATPYGVDAAGVRAAPTIPEAVTKLSAEELELHARRAVKPPKRVWGDGLLVLFGQPATVTALITLCFVGMAAGAMVRVAASVRPDVRD